MYDKLKTYKIWAPSKNLWSAWAKPVIFANAKEVPLIEIELQSQKWINIAHKSVMIIVDLPAETSVLETIALAQLGYRPIPLYNGVTIANKKAMLVDNSTIVETLFNTAPIIEKLSLPYDAPPCFMIDSNRMVSKNAYAGKFDNRYSIFPQDMPSADYLIQNNIREIIIKTYAIKEDLKHILYRYQEKGIQIKHCSAKASNINEKQITKPLIFSNIIYRYKVLTRLRRSAIGGFGATIPTQSSGRIG